MARVFGALLAAGLLVAMVLLAGLEGGSAARGSVHNAEDDGWLALYQTLGELGFEPEAWDDELERLPAGRHALWWGRAPLAEELLEPQNESAQPRPADALDRWLLESPDAPRQLRRFLVQGGCLVAPPTPATLEWLAREAGLVELEGARLEPRRRSAGPARGSGGERFQLEARTVSELVDLDPQVSREVLLADSDGTPLALEVAVGRGGVVLLPNSELFDNARLRDGDAALFAVRLAETLAPGGRILFDEGLGKHGSAPGLGDLLAGPTLGLASIHAALLLLLALWLALVPREFAREPQHAARVSALSRARARANLALRAGRASVLAAPLRAGVLRRVARRLRVRLGDGAVEGDAAGDLAALQRAAGARLDLERWTQALTRALPDDPDALAELDRELRRLESELAAPHDARPEPPDASLTAARTRP